MQEGKHDVVTLLLEKDDKGRVKLPPLHIAAKKDDVQAAILLLQNENKAETAVKVCKTKLMEIDAASIRKSCCHFALIRCIFALFLTKLVCVSYALSDKYHV